MESVYNPKFKLGTTGSESSQQPIQPIWLQPQLSVESKNAQPHNVVYKQYIRFEKGNSLSGLIRVAKSDKAHRRTAKTTKWKRKCRDCEVSFTKQMLTFAALTQ